MDRGETAGAFFGTDEALLREHLLECLRQRLRGLKKAARRCRKRSSENAVHQLRVQLRRLLALLELLTCIVPEVHLQRARKKLKKRLDRFDKLRDTHVQLLFTGGMLRDFLELKALHKKLQRRENRLLKPATKHARKCSVGWLAHTRRMIKTHVRAAFRLHSGRARPVDRLAAGIQKAFDRVTALRAQIDPKQVETIHRTRIAFKKFRYMIELLHPLLPAIQARQLVAMDSYQTMMGEIQDIGMLRETLNALVRKGKLKKTPLKRFNDLLANRQAILIRGYLEAADELFTFWPPAYARMSTSRARPATIAA